MSMSIDSSPKVSRIGFNSSIIDAAGEPVVMSFQVSGNLQYRVTCPKEYITSSSKYVRDLLNQRKKEEQNSQVDINLQELGVHFGEKHFYCLSSYINEGRMDANWGWNWKVRDRVELCVISNLLGLDELTACAVKEIVCDGNFFDYKDEQLDVFCFGIKHSIPLLLNATLPFILGDYLTNAQKPPTQKYLRNRLALIKKSVAIAKIENIVKLVTQGYTPEFIREGKKIYSIFPKELGAIFPKASEIEIILQGYYPRRCYLADIKEYENGEMRCSHPAEQQPDDSMDIEGKTEDVAEKAEDGPDNIEDASDTSDNTEEEES